jgi:hypothetical protein
MNEGNVKQGNTRHERIDFDKWYAQQAAEVDQMSIRDARKRRVALIAIVDQMPILMREDGITAKRRSYLIGRRKFVTKMISYINERIKLFNIVAHNGNSANLAMRFVQIASEELTQQSFQKIYGLAVLEAEEKESSIKAIRDFVDQFKQGFLGTESDNIPDRTERER